MKQLSLPGVGPPDAVVNVASVKHRSPFRYPGGKTWLVPRIRRWLLSLPPARRRTFVEPFAGGAIVGLTAAFEHLADHVVLVELDDQVAAVWETLITAGEGAWLADRILAFDLTPDNVAALLSAEHLSRREQALRTIVKNRVNRGGILAPGAGQLKHGENGKGITSRWYPETLARRIRAIDAIRERLTFVHGDGMAILAQQCDTSDAVFFIDPPYTAGHKRPGSRLYTYSEVDHPALFSTAAELAGDVLLTYNRDTVIEQLAVQHGFGTRPVAMKNTHHARQTELLIGRDLAWTQ